MRIEAWSEILPWLAGLLGLVLGSFYNVCVHRYICEQSIVRPGSHCPKCGHMLAWFENVPLLSFILLGGRCRVCRQAISLRYPVVEALSGLWAVLLALKFGPSPAFAVYMLFGGIFIVASFIDFELYILPDFLTLPGALLAWLCAWFWLGISWQDSLLGAVVGGGIFWLISEVYLKLRGIDGLGLGDVKLMLCLGALVGWQGLAVSVLLAGVSALAASPFYLRGGDIGRTPIPFGPFLCLGAMLEILLGPGLAGILAP